VLKRAFSMFDSSKTGKIEKEKVRTILNTLGHTYDDTELDNLLEAEDAEGIFSILQFIYLTNTKTFVKNIYRYSPGTGQLAFDSFCRVAAHFNEEDDEALQKELKEAFRLYDKEGNGFIPTSSLKEILAALDDQLTADQLSGKEDYLFQVASE
jgi:calmodulin